MHPYLDERQPFANRIEAEAGANAREAARFFGVDYVEGQLTEANLYGYNPSAEQDAARRLANEALAIEQDQRRRQMAGAGHISTGPSKSTTPATSRPPVAPKSPSKSISPETRLKRNIEAIEAVHQSIDRKLAHDPPLPLNDQETVLQKMRADQEMIKSWSKRDQASRQAEWAGDLGTKLLILFWIGCVFFTIGIIAERFFL